MWNAAWDILLKRAKNSAKLSNRRKPIGTRGISLLTVREFFYYYCKAKCIVPSYAKKQLFLLPVTVICIASRIILELLQISTTVCFRSYVYREQISVERECYPTRLTYRKTHPRHLTYLMIRTLSLCYADYKCYLNPTSFLLLIHEYITLYFTFHAYRNFVMLIFSICIGCILQKSILSP